MNIEEVRASNEFRKQRMKGQRGMGMTLTRYATFPDQISGWLHHMIWDSITRMPRNVRWKAQHLRCRNCWRLSGL